ncbi:TAXI family TRAP transporter solute-binding subunit [Acidaminobacter sp. JC074]|nr:TAXI family TRAP transporter solute-binding subunit [Acidaminobacter sp. JC074]
MKRLILLIILIFLFGCSNQVIELDFATGGVGGVYYPLGSTIAELISDNVDNVLVNAYTGNASVSNTNLIHEGEIEMALVQSNVANWAREGIDTFEAPVEEIYAVASLYSEVIQVVVRADAEIESFEDLRGEHISLGKIDSGNYFDAVNILKAHDIELKDIHSHNLTFSESFDMLVNGEIDAVFLTSGIPTSSVTLISSKIDIRLLGIDEETLQSIIEDFSFYTREIIPAKTYLGQEKDIITLSTRALWVCHESVDEEIVYESLKGFYQSHEDLRNSHKSLRGESLNTALDGIAIPLHPGAKKYYKEMNFEVDD